MSTESEEQIEHEKPPFFYHASPNRELEMIEPRAETVRDDKEGAVVFGTADKGLASVFMIEHDDSWTASGQIEGRLFLLYTDAERLRQADRGGALYVLPAESFSQDTDDDQHHSEWVSRGSVTPIEKTDYESGVEAMKENGVEMFAVDKQTLREFQAASVEEKAAMLASLRGEVVDEKK